MSVHARADLIEKFIGLESLVDQIIATYYVGRNDQLAWMFQLQVLYDSQCTLGLKLNVLEKLLASVYPNAAKRKLAKDQFNTLRRFGNIRNHYAHAGREIAVKEKHGPGRAVVIFDSKDLTKPLNLDAEYNEFIRDYPSIRKWLCDLLEQVPNARKEGQRQFQELLSKHLGRQD